MKTKTYRIKELTWTQTAGNRWQCDQTINGNDYTIAIRSEGYALLYVDDTGNSGLVGYRKTLELAKQEVNDRLNNLLSNYIEEVQTKKKASYFATRCNNSDGSDFEDMSFDNKKKALEWAKPFTNGCVREVTSAGRKEIFRKGF